MTIKFRKIIALSALGAGLMLSSCKDFLDINDDPTRITEQQITIQALLPTTIEATSQATHQYAFATSQIVQYMASVAGGGVDAHNEVRMGDAWITSYATAMSNLKTIIEKASDPNDFSPYYASVAKILLAYNLGMATSTWGNVPYSQAFSIKNLRPEYDTQEAIYAEINKLLDEAIADIDKVSSKSPGTEDVAFYTMNTTAALTAQRNRWKATARVLKARYAMHFSLKNPTQAATNALAALSTGAMTAFADDLQLNYNTRNLNPWNTRVAQALVTGNFTVSHSNQLIESMNGVSFGVFDPRLPIIAGRGASATTWTGRENGSGSGGGTDLTINTWHGRNVAPIQMVTYAEQEFIRAEAEFLRNGGTTTSKGTTTAGYTAYLNGINASMQKLGVVDSARTRYTSDTKVNVGAANLTLQLIMAEKYKAQFLHPETWNDMRRWEYSKDVFKDLDLPRNQNPELGNKWIERAFYPNDEFNRNGEVARKNQQPLNTKLWIFTK
jgi:hypothetical protein